MHQDRGLRFPCNDRTDEVNKLFIIWLIYSCMKIDFVSKVKEEIELSEELLLVFRKMIMLINVFA